MKLCPYCKIIKSIDDYRPSQYKKNSGWCRLCCKRYEEANKDKKAKYNAEYAKKNKMKITQNRKNKKEHYNLKQRERRNKNREVLNARYLPTALKYKKNKRIKNKEFKLRELISSTINRSLKKQKSSKNNISMLKYLSYTMRELKEHLEGQFESWMNWNNWGKYKVDSWDDNNSSTWTWQIDHVVPQSYFPYLSMEDENFKQCWALNNLRPYSAKQNIIDGHRRINDQA